MVKTAHRGMELQVNGGILWAARMAGWVRMGQRMDRKTAETKAVKRGIPE